EAIAVGPVDFRANALPGAQAKLASNGVGGCGLQTTVEIGGSPAIDGHDLHVRDRHQARRDQRTQQILDLRPLENVATLEPRDRRDVPRTEWRLAADVDRTEPRYGSGIHGQHQAREVRLM